MPGGISDDPLRGRGIPAALAAERSYRRTDLLDKGRELATAWSAHCSAQDRPSHGGNAGSNPVRDTNYVNILLKDGTGDAVSRSNID